MDYTEPRYTKGYRYIVYHGRMTSEHTLAKTAQEAHRLHTAHAETGAQTWTIEARGGSVRLW